MNEVTEILADFDISKCDNLSNGHINYIYINFFKNPNKLPLNEVFIERVRVKLNRSFLANPKHVKTKEEASKCVDKTKEVIPALDKSWLPEFIITFEYQEYNLNKTEEENSWFLESNKNYVHLLDHLIKCSYHQFWCTVLFNEQVQCSLRSFINCPIPPYMFRELGPESKKLYESIFNGFYMVCRKLIFFKKSEIEYMAKHVGNRYLIDNQLLNLPISVTLTLLYQDFDNELIDELREVYFEDKSQKKFVQKEIEQMLKHSVMVFEVIGGHVSGNLEPGHVMVPISLQKRPKVFSLEWVNSVINYLLNMIHTLYSLFHLHNTSIKQAIKLHVPEKISQTYETVFKELYTLLEGRSELTEQPQLADRIWYKIGLTRSKCVDTFHCFVTYCLDQTLTAQGDENKQQEYVETFINVLTGALEYEIFICDYNAKYNIRENVEMFESCSPIDKTRTEYILSSVNNFSRNDFIKQRSKIENVFVSNLPTKSQEIIPEPCNSREMTTNGPSANHIEDSIDEIIQMFPHLGDGFILACLEQYDYKVDAVVHAILEENLPPHIMDIPFDQIRIPPEPEPAKPILAYRGKKPDYVDAMDLLDDKKEKEKMKTYILDGIHYNNRYDNSEDEYDDRDDSQQPDYVVEYECERYENRIEEDLVSDTSYSEEEFDEGGQPVQPKNNKNFCEDPAVIRARYEAQRGIVRKKTNVVGKPKGEGQDKSVLNSRQKKNVNKSSRANHNRKSGADFKRNKGMF